MTVVKSVVNFLEAFEVEVIHRKAKNGKNSHFESKKFDFFFFKFEISIFSSDNRAGLYFAHVYSWLLITSSPLYEGLHLQGPLKNFLCFI